MNKNNLFRKGLIVGIIVLFIGVAIVPGITVAIHLSDATSTKIPESENLNNDLVEITIQICEVDGARSPGSSLFSSEEVKDTDTIFGPKTDSIFSRGIFNFFSKILDAFPILAGFIERFIPKYPEEPAEPEEPEKPEVAPEPPKKEPKDETPAPAPETPIEEPPKEEKTDLPEEPDEQEEIPLELTLKLIRQYKEGDPIPVAAILTNIGDEPLTVCAMNFKTGTLDFFIDTPNGDTIHFIGPVNDSEMRLWRLMPQESRSIDIEIVKSGLFGPPSVTDLHYKFIEGEYTITGYYKSFATQGYILLLDFWEGELHSRTYEFTIIPK